jgi:hypothetical protein
MVGLLLLLLDYEFSQPASPASVWLWKLGFRHSHCVRFLVWVNLFYFIFSLLFSIVVASDYPFGIRLSQRVDGRTLIMFNARNDHDRAKFCEDLREAILEMDEMENLRIEGELDKQRTAARISRAPTTPTSIQPPPGMGNGASSSNLLASGRDNRDSGVADMDHNGSVTTLEETSSSTTPLSRRTSNSSVQQRSVVIRETGGGRTEATLKRTTLSNS